MLQSQDLEGHVAGGQDQDPDPAQTPTRPPLSAHSPTMEMKSGYCAVSAASAQVPFNEERLTKPNK